MDRLPAHFRQDPSQWKDINNFMTGRKKNNAKAHYKAFRDFLHWIHNAQEAGDTEKATALELLETVTVRRCVGRLVVIGSSQRVNVMQWLTDL